MNTAWLDQRLDYDGSQLAAHWIQRTTGIVGDALVAFRGACAVVESEMADLEDLLHGPGIAGADMVHFLWEVFDDGDLERAVLRQRLLAANAFELLAVQTDAALRRRGDDLFVDDRKLSISVATRSPVSTLIHFAVNVTNQGAPVETAGLTGLGVEPESFATALLAAALREQESLQTARCQVRAKGEASP